MLPHAEAVERGRRSPAVSEVLTFPESDTEVIGHFMVNLEVLTAPLHPLVVSNIQVGDDTAVKI